jgi:hypothetical protein
VTAPILPELTRSLRALGASTGTIGGLDVTVAQVRYFQPLLEARRRAADAHEVAEVVRIFHGASLASRVTGALQALAREHAGGDARVRRATETLLVEAIEPLRGAVQTLDDRAPSAAAGVTPEWDAWVAALLAVYRCADDCWFAVERALADAPIPEPPAARGAGKRPA